MGVLSLLVDIVLATLVISRIKTSKLYSIVFLREFRFTTAFIILMSITVGSGFLGAELRHKAVSMSTIFQWIYVFLKWTWMFVLIYWALYARDDIHEYIVQRCCIM